MLKQQPTEDRSARRIGTFGTAILVLGAATILAAVVVYLDLFQLQSQIQNWLHLERILENAPTLPEAVQTAYLSQLVEATAVVAVVFGVFAFVVGFLMRGSAKR